jgi:hypothetical protein
MVQTKAQKDVELDVKPLDEGMIACAILGTSPIILYRMSEKGARELLFPAGRKTVADRAATMKHDPIAEFKSSPYTRDFGETYLTHLGTAFKGAISGAAIDMPGANKAQIGRLLQVEDEFVPIYGIPKLHMAIVRSADINHTPDVRTRCVVPEWASYITISFVRPLLNEQTVATLLHAAGIIQGVGDFRPGKGKGTYGRFRIVRTNDPDWVRITKGSSPEMQRQAMKDAVPYNAEAAELLAWFKEAKIRRNKAPSAAEVVEQAEASGIEST